MYIRPVLIQKNVQKVDPKVGRMIVWPKVSRINIKWGTERIQSWGLLFQVQRKLSKIKQKQCQTLMQQ